MTNCPTTEELDDWLRSDQGPECDESLEDHIESCSSCQFALKTLTDERQLRQLDSIASADHHWHGVADRIAKLLVRETERDRHAEPPCVPHGAVSPNRHDGILPTIPGYDFQSVIGEGGMGTVYHAIQEQFDRAVAIKVLQDVASDDSELIQRFQREMTAIGKLDHLNIVQAYHADEHDGLHYLVMERVCGETLSEIIRARAYLRQADVCEVIRQVAVGLTHAHDNGLVHRDIKPSNIMVSEAGVAKILDLGLARLGVAGDSSSGALTLTGQVIGTMDYMAPEQAVDPRRVDASADVFGLGATLFRMVTGTRPFPFRRRTFFRDPASLVTTVPPRMSDRCTGVSEELDEIAFHMMAPLSKHRMTLHDCIAAIEPMCEYADVASLLAAVESPDATTQLLPLNRRMTSGVAAILCRTVDDQVVDNAVGDIERLLELIPEPDLRQIARLRVEGYESDAIAIRMDCSARTVERRLDLVGKLWRSKVR